ncbi:hypothetical protein KUTeg_015435 [Tegillarca granosa]|uniref:Beta/gamma crystallin 'Greek key' domain-containing protein n=1 Tax=Tegillarca granosa TaxID=220873 RepID=A0ABQ9ESI9_TEGGR|nr:hypothetical protein KUTeg_015435 [Tegillarca granosa]
MHGKRVFKGLLTSSLNPFSNCGRQKEPVLKVLKMAELTVWQNTDYQGRKTSAQNTGIPRIDGGALSMKLQATEAWTIYEGPNYQGQQYSVGKVANFPEPSAWGGNTSIQSARPTV